MVVKKFKDIAKDDIHLAGEKMKLQDIYENPIILEKIEHASTELKIENPLEKHICQNPRSIHKQLN